MYYLRAVRKNIFFTLLFLIELSIAIAILLFKLLITIVLRLNII